MMPMKNQEKEGRINMLFISDILTTVPTIYKTSLQEKTYEALSALQIPFQRVETNEIITMEDCIQVNQKLQMKMVKTLFLCNRQQSEFHLFITCGKKPFKSKDFSGVLGISRVSFAPPELMEGMLGTKIGAATIFSTLLDNDGAIRVVFDKDVAVEEWYGCSDGTTTSYMKVKTAQILRDFLNYTRHHPKIIEI
jgi:Ala-tRNA(Pro) deacylase